MFFQTSLIQFNRSSFFGLFNFFLDFFFWFGSQVVRSSASSQCHKVVPVFRKIGLIFFVLLAIRFLSTTVDDMLNVLYIYSFSLV